MVSGFESFGRGSSEVVQTVETGNDRSPPGGSRRSGEVWVSGAAHGAAGGPPSTCMLSA